MYLYLRYIRKLRVLNSHSFPLFLAYYNISRTEKEELCFLPKK